MAIEECLHCLEKVLFSDAGICPSCRPSKYLLPGKQRDQIAFEKDHKELKRNIDYLNKRIPSLIIGGGLLASVVLIAIIVTIGSGNHVFWHGGIFIGLGMIVQGWRDITHKNELQIEFNQKYKDR